MTFLYPGMNPRIKVKGTSHRSQCMVTLTYNIRYVFIDFRTVDEASFALAAMDGFPFDTRHTFRVNRFTDIERYANLDENYVEPEPEEYKARVRISGTNFPGFI